MGQDSYFWIKSHCKLAEFELLSWRLVEEGAEAIEELDLVEDQQYFRICTSDQGFVLRIQELFPELEIETGEEENVDWDEHWRKEQGPLQISEHLWVCPPWVDFKAPEGSDCLKIEAKMAFGTGEHETTKLVAQLQKKVIEGSSIQSVLDVGTGTGILLMHAMKLGVSEGWFTEIDPVTLPCIVENFPLNGLNVPFGMLGPLENLRKPDGFDLILCNMIRSEFWPMKEDVLRLLNQGGKFILSGQLVKSDRSILLEWFEKVSLRVEKEDTLGEWWGVVVTKE